MRLLLLWGSLQTLCTGLAAQSPAIESDLSDLQRPGTREAAVARLGSRGRAAVKPLCDFAVRSAPSDAAATVAAVRALILIGSDGSDESEAVLLALERLRPALPDDDQFKKWIKAPPDLASARAMEPGELFLGLCVVRAAMDLAADATPKDLIAHLDDAHVSRALAAAGRITMHGADAKEALPALRALRDSEVLNRTVIVPPTVVEAREEQGAHVASFAGMHCGMVISVGNDTLRFANSHLIDDLLTRAIIAVAARDPAVIPMLLRYLGSADPFWRARSASALGEIGPAAAETSGALCVAARDSDPNVAREAIMALGRIGKDNVIVRRTLRSAADGSNKEIATCAAAALAQLDRTRAAPSKRR